MRTGRFLGAAFAGAALVRAGLIHVALLRAAFLRAALLGLAALCWLPGAWAHKASDAYLLLGAAAEPASTAARGEPPAEGLALRLSLALKDLDAALETLDADGDRQLTWGEVRASLPAVQQWVAGGFALRCGEEALPLSWSFDALEQRSDGSYLRLKAETGCAPSAPLALDYRLLQGIDPTHRLLVSGRAARQPVAAVLAPDGQASVALRRGTAAGTSTGTEEQTGAGAQAGTAAATLANFFTEGVHHILTGYDHLAFLLALLLPISLRRTGRMPGARTWSRPGEADAHAAVPGGGGDASRGGPARPGLGALLLTVTGFTVGHSVTLALASLGLISASPEWVEPAIALSIGASALLNLCPVRWLRGELLALGFGLVHGLGFSGVMAEAGVQGPLLLWALAGFNLGVEAGQLACVLLWCALHLALVRWARYEQVVVRGGSAALVLLALYWTVQRVAG